MFSFSPRVVTSHCFSPNRRHMACQPSMVPWTLTQEKRMQFQCHTLYHEGLSRKIKTFLCFFKIYLIGGELLYNIVVVHQQTNGWESCGTYTQWNVIQSLKRIHLNLGCSRGQSTSTFACYLFIQQIFSWMWCTRYCPMNPGVWNTYDHTLVETTVKGC